MSFFANLLKLATLLRHQQGHQRAGALTSSIFIFIKGNFFIKWKKHQKTVDFRKGGKRTNCFPEAIKVFFHYYLREIWTGGRASYSKKNCIGFIRLVTLLIVPSFSISFRFKMFCVPFSVLELSIKILF